MRGHPDPQVPLGSIASKAGATGPLTIAGLERAQVRDAVDVLCDSHAEYPAFSHLFPDRDSRRRILRALFTATVQDARSFGAVLTASVAGRMLGVGVWLPPGRFPWSAWRKLRGTRGFLPVLRWAPDRIAEFSALGRNIEQAFPDTPHWYLEVLGVRAGAQGRGIGQALMRPAMGRADRDRLPCHLETSDPANIAFYERLGFVFAEQRQLIPGGPPHYTMRRRPRPGSEL